MLNGINVEEIKKYNESLKAHNERASKLRAEIDFNKNELTRLCAELTQELGVTVTLENVRQIYDEKVRTINANLESGKEILRRVAEEEAAANNQDSMQTIATGQLIEEPVNTGNIGVETPQVAPIAPQMPTTSTVGVFANQGIQL